MDSFRTEFVGHTDKALAYRDSALAEHARHVRANSPYIVSLPMQVRAVMLRKVQIMKGNLAAPIIKTL
jgi:ATP-binding cassette subfamily G (WHITE) protein 2 (SNQ2)